MPGFPGIFASNAGDLWSYRRFEWRGKRWNGWRKLKQHPNSDGYPTSSVPSPARSRGRGNFTVHTLVALAFFGPRPAGMVVTHLDGSRTNNRVENLAYRTSAENTLDKHRHGTMVRGEQHPATKLSDEQCREVLRLSSAGVAQTELARRFGVNKTTIWNIRRGRTRSHLQHSLH